MATGALILSTVPKNALYKLKSKGSLSRITTPAKISIHYSNSQNRRALLLLVPIVCKFYHNWSNGLDFIKRFLP